MNTNLSIRINSTDKKNFEHFCKETGMNVTTAVNMFIKAVLREHKIPFDITYDEFYSEKNINYLEKTVENIKSGKAKIEEHDLIEGK